MDTLTGDPIPTRTLSRTPLSRAIRERLTDEPSAKSVPWHPAPVELDESKITRGDSATWRVANRSTGVWPQTLHICFPTSGWSIHSSGLSRCLDRTSAHTNTWWSLRSGVWSVWVLETWPGSPGSWCATWDGDHSTDRWQSGHSWLLPNQWVMHPSLDLRGDKELPAPCPETRTKGFLHMSKARRLDLDHAKCFPSGRTPWSWATTVEVSCTAGQKVSRWTAAVF